VHRDYLDILRAFENSGVEYLLVGAYAVSKHGYARTTGIWTDGVIPRSRMQ
jgi:hypothetical protein